MNRDGTASPIRRPARDTQTALQFQTQNLQGFSKTGSSRAEWFNSFRAMHDGARVDAVFVQETRAHGHWPTTLAAQYENSWDFCTGALDAPLSYWSESSAAVGGVAILLNPHSSLQDVEPLWPDLWSPHFIALRASHENQPVNLLCIYGPTASRARETLFDSLARMTPPSGVIVLGGDFNCTQDADLDRSRTTTKNYSSHALSKWLHAWDLLDSTVPDALEATTARSIADFHSDFHTYFYGYGAAKTATCRLDRFYLDRASVARIIGVDTMEPALHVDHQAVYLRLSHNVPRRTKRTKRQVLRYPLPRCATRTVAQLSQTLLQSQALPLATMSPEASAARWDKWKITLRRACLQGRSKCLKRATADYRRQVFRLRRSLKRATRASSQSLSPVSDLTDAMERLSLDAHGRVLLLRRSLIAIRIRHLARRSRAKYAQYAGRGPSSTRAFYKRISVKFAARRAVSLPDTVPATRPPQDPATQDAFFRRLPARQRVDMPDLDAPFTEDEVHEAIKACPRSKACGPDGIPNDWYRDQIDALPAILAPLFTAWHGGHVLPASFKQATVYCIPKNAKPQTGLDFRPIALLNTDYKLYARILLNRVRKYLPQLVADTQFGFVPGRQVHDAIDVWTAARKVMLESAAPSSAFALMLDFAKAYDTLDRRYLLEALRRHGFSHSFVQAVGAMHLATTASYLADGSESAEHAVLTGIRQGCPLAPVLFILALDPLYDLVNHEQRIHGVPLTTETSVKIAGFADDTAIYVATVEEEGHCLQLLQAFGDASGLRVNISKSSALYLRHDVDVAATHTVPPCRAAIWERTLQQLRGRLALAQIKTLNLEQRVQICRAVILPKLLFIGRHSWPSRCTIDKLQKLIHNYAWFGQLTVDRQQRRAWLNSDTASLETREGGLALPNLLHHFEKLSAKTVARWASASSPITTAVGAIMLWKPHRGRRPKDPLPVSRTPHPSIQYRDTQAATGISVVRHALVQERTGTERQLLEQAWQIPTGDDGPPVWDGEWLYLPMHGRHTVLSALCDYQAATFGAFQVHALLRASIDTGAILLDATGLPLTHGAFSGAVPAHMAIGDFLQLERVGAWTLRCRHRLFPYKHRSRRTEGFMRFCKALVINYPALILPQSPRAYLHPLPPTLARWALQFSEHGVGLVWEPSSTSSENLGTVQSMAEAVRVAHERDPTLRGFAPHPWLEATTTLWADPHRPRAPRLYATLISTTARTRGLRIIEAKRQQATRDSPTLATSLQHLRWTAISRLHHGTSSQRLLLFRLKHLRVGGWDRAHEQRGCPHCPEHRASASSSFHTIWHCRQAQLLWGVIRDYWSNLGVWTTTSENADFQHACMSLQLTRFPEKLWASPEPACSPYPPAGDRDQDSRDDAGTLAEALPSRLPAPMAMALRHA